MLPNLFVIPIVNLSVYTYGIMMASGFLIAVYISFLQAKKFGCYSNDVLDFSFWVLLGGLLGARTLYIIIEWQNFFIINPWTQVANVKIPSILAFWQGGLVIWGGLLGGFFTFLLFSYKRKIKTLIFADILILGLPLAQSLGRVGCIAAGCCWGKYCYYLDSIGKVATKLPLTIKFPPGSLAYEYISRACTIEEYELMKNLNSTLPLFPIQLIESFGLMVIFFILLNIYSNKKFHGKVMFSYFILYSAFRFFVEIFRGDIMRGFIFENLLSTSQFISILVFFPSILCLIILRYRSIKFENKKI